MGNCGQAPEACGTIAEDKKVTRMGSQNVTHTESFPELRRLTNVSRSASDREGGPLRRGGVCALLPRIGTVRHAL